MTTTPKPTTHDFETALVAKHPDGRIAARIDPDDVAPWAVAMPDRYYGWVRDDEMPGDGFIPAIPVTTPREGYEAAWDLAYVLPKDAVIPAGTPYITRWQDSEVNVFPEGASGEALAHGINSERRLLDAPALARSELSLRIEEILRVPGKHDPAVLADRIAKEAGR